ncbi:MAG: hypothetical protein ABIH72_02160 [archaeon]
MKTSKKRSESGNFFDSVQKSRISGRKVIALCFIIIIISSYLVLSQQTSTGRFRVANEPPYTDSYEVRDGSSNWDSSAPIDTHDLTTELRWRVRDPNPDQITTRICIGTVSNPLSTEACTIVNYTLSPSPRNSPQTYTYGTDPLGPGTTDIIKLSDTDCNFVTGLCSKTFYVDLYVTDSGTPQKNSTNSYSFILINSVPNIPTGLVQKETHDQTPQINWTGSDPDDGSQDHWPADTLNYNAYVGATPGAQEYLVAYLLANPQATVTNPIPWGTPGAVDARTTTYTRLWSTDNFGINSTSNDTFFELVDYLPQFSDVYIGDVPGDEVTCTKAAQYCLLYPESESYAPVNIIYEFNDTDGDCSAVIHGASAALCLIDASSPQSCLSGSANFTYPLIFSASSGTLCNFSVSIPAGDSRGIEFFRAPQDYKLYLNASSQAGISTLLFNYNWTYAPLYGIAYPISVDLGDPIECGGDDVQLGSWNNGTCLSYLNNSGNVALNLNWTAEDPILDGPGGDCSPSNTTCWDLSADSNFSIDDDSALFEDIGLASSNILESPVDVPFFPAGGLDVCDVMSCNNPSLDETLNTYFHIMPPLGLEPGTYETRITITIDVV